MTVATTLHASVALVGKRGVLIRGASGSGKSALLLALIAIDPKRNALVADDQTNVAAINGRVVASAPSALAGLIEVRGQGILKRAHVSPVVVDFVVDLAAPDQSPRMPEAEQERTNIVGIVLPRLILPIGVHDGALRVCTAIAARLL